MLRPRLLPAPCSRALGIAALAFAASLSVACDRSTTEPGATLGYETLAKASVPAQSPARLREVVRSAARYEAVWRELWGDREVGRPRVDFDRDMVIVMTHSVESCMGEVDIEGVEPRGGRFVVKAGESTPHLCSCAAAETTFHVVKGPRLPEPIGFEMHPIRSRCG